MSCLRLQRDPDGIGEGRDGPAVRLVHLVSDEPCHLFDRLLDLRHIVSAGTETTARTSTDRFEHFDGMIAREQLPEIVEPRLRGCLLERE